MLPGEHVIGRLVPVDPTMRFGFLSDVSRLISLVALYDVHPADVTDVDLARRLLRATRGALDGDFSGKGPVDVWPCLAREVMSHDILAGLARLPEGEVELAELGDAAGRTRRLGVPRHRRGVAACGLVARFLGEVRAEPLVLVFEQVYDRP